MFFVNGMNTDRVGANKQRELLKKAFEAHIEGTVLENRVRYALALNPSEGFVLDLFEAFQQRSNVEKKEALRHLVEEANWVSDSAKDILQTQMEQAIEKAAQNPYVSKHVEMYNN
ncbi:hypothetical protein JCM19231_2047 [Vibrio ishigakensis]|uniref:Uncharacterized protein n=1 Tax=Vibrio ishigakensis TaxID=1481914 RepID=A0A0B8P1U6_9VIBR|nr:hypothetical protein JCM19231_2047 [Vibrio ishigakensis]